MKKNRLLSLILVLTLLVGTLIPGSIFADDATEPAPGAAESQLTEEPEEEEQLSEEPEAEDSTPQEEESDPPAQSEEEPNEEVPAQNEQGQETNTPSQQDKEEDPADPEQDEQEAGQNQEPVNVPPEDQPDETEEPETPAGDEPSQEQVNQENQESAKDNEEPQEPAGEEPEDKPEEDEPEEDEPEEDEPEEIRFESGYVRLKPRTIGYTDVYQTEEAGTFAEYAVAYAEADVRAEEAEQDWLKLTFDTQEAKAGGEDFVVAFVQMKDVTPLTAEDTEWMLANEMPDDAREYNGIKLPLAAFQKAEKEPSEESVPDEEEADEPVSIIEDAETNADAVWEIESKIGDAEQTDEAVIKPGLDDKVQFVYTGTWKSSYTIQWYKRSIDAEKGKKISNATSKNYTIKKIAKTSYDYVYYAVVTAGSKTHQTNEILVDRPYTLTVSVSVGGETDVLEDGIRKKVGMEEEAVFTATLSDGVEGQFFWEKSYDGKTWERFGDGPEDSLIITPYDDDEYSPQYRVRVESEKGRANSTFTIIKPFVVTVKVKQNAGGIFLTPTIKEDGVEKDPAGYSFQWMTYDLGNKVDVSQTEWPDCASDDDKAKGIYKPLVKDNEIFEPGHTFFVIVTDKTTGKVMNTKSGATKVKKPYTVTPSEPVSYIVGYNMSKKLTVSAPKAKSPISYEWQKYDDALDDWVSIEGATKESYKIGKVKDDSPYGIYRCRMYAKNGIGFSAEITVEKPFTEDFGLEGPAFIPSDPEGGLDAMLTAHYVPKAGLKYSSIAWEWSSDGEIWSKAPGKVGADKKTIWLLPVDSNAYGRYVRAKVTVKKGTTKYYDYTDPVRVEKNFEVSTSLVYTDNNQREHVFRYAPDRTSKQVNPWTDNLRLEASAENGREYKWYRLDGTEWTQVGIGATLQIVPNEADGIQGAKSYFDKPYRCLVTDADGNTVISGSVTITAPYTVTATSTVVYNKELTQGTVTLKASATTPEPEADVDYEWRFTNNADNDWHNWDVINPDDVPSGFALLENHGLEFTAAIEDFGKYRFKCIVTVNDPFVEPVPSNEIEMDKQQGKANAKDIEITPAADTPITVDEKKVGKTAKFTVTASLKPSSFVWQYSTDGGLTWAKVTSKQGTQTDDTTKKTSTLSVKVDKKHEAYWRQYRCVVTVSKMKLASGSFCVQPDSAKYFTYGPHGNIDEHYLAIEGVAAGAVLPEDLTLPTGYHGLKVTAIVDGQQTGTDGEGGLVGTGALSEQTVIKTLTIPFTILDIGSYAFYGCTGMTTVNLSTNVYYIGKAAFKNCSHLATMNPD